MKELFLSIQIENFYGVTRVKDSNNIFTL